MRLSHRSEMSLEMVHPDLVKVIRHAAKTMVDPTVSFIVTEGCRTMEKQRKLVASGASRTLNSRHIPGGHPAWGKAVDLAVMVDGEVRWDWPLYEDLSKIIKRAAIEVGVSITWGGDWPKLRDGPHYELDWKVYP